METRKFDRKNYLSYLFFDPVAIIACFSLEAVSGAFKQLEVFLDQGCWAAGFFSYEMGYCWDDFKGKGRFSFPLIWLGIFKSPVIFNHLQGKFSNLPPEPRGINTVQSSRRKSRRTQQASASTLWRGEKYQIKGIKTSERLTGYVKDIKRIKDYIAQGFTYQVNYTFKYKFNFQGSSMAFYKNLRNAQPVAYTAFIRDARFQLLSFSPELFFRKKGRVITVMPMKGTISRARTQKEDRLQIKRLRASEKDRSENVMIVDLLRNDLGRISETGSVKLNKLYAIEKYNTLFQMTSTVQAKLKKNLSYYELFRSLFPSGSVTGAPKIKTMEIIRKLEKERRGVYTGAVGFFKPNRDAVFNVAIRTLLLRGKTGRMGIGSGIVYDSESEREYKECKLKALFFTRKIKEFQLIETMRWSKKGGFFLLDYHLERLRSSAEYFNFTLNEQRIKQELNRIRKCLNCAYAYRVRLLVFPRGDIKLSYGRIREGRSPGTRRVTFTRRKTNSQDTFFYHKSTNRQLYNHEYLKAKRAGFFEVIFENEKGQITEGAVSNIFIRKGKMYYTPPISCGLLDGVYRRYFMKKKAPFAAERILRRRDLFEADAVYVTNAVRGITRVRLV